MLLSPAAEKVTKERRLRARGAAELDRLKFEQVQIISRSVLCNPLPLKNPITPALLRSAFGEVRFGMIVIEIGDSDLDGSARDAEHKGFAFAVKFISLSYGSCHSI